MTLDLSLAVAFAVIMAVLPYAVFTGTARHRYGIADGVGYAAFLAGALLGSLFNLALPAPLAFALFIVVKLVIFLALLVVAPVSESQWSPKSAAFLAGAVYLILIPHVLQRPIDGDEPFYLLASESLARDGDLDLRNQYENLDRSVIGRPDLEPQTGDPVGPNGQQYSRHEPFLSLLLIPGHLAGGVEGAAATIALFGALLIWSTLSLAQDLGISRRGIVVLFGLLLLSPPILNYSVRIWPEVPAAFFFVQTLRSVMAKRRRSAVLYATFLTLLKIRFIPVVAVLILLDIRNEKRLARGHFVALTLILIPILIVFIVSGQLLNVHSVGEILPQSLWRYIRGLVGIVLDAQTGLLFQAPLLFLGLFALLKWRELPRILQMGLLSSVVYLLLLLPRDEWHGGWSPPLRYLMIFIPLLALGAVWLWDQGRFAGVFGPMAIWSAGLAIHAIAFPWRQFHIANGESVSGEFLSRIYASDFSRLFPSLIRLNRAAIAGSVLLLILVILIFIAGKIRANVSWRPIALAFVALSLSAGFVAGRAPSPVVELEDAHVRHTGGELYPHMWTVARFRFDGGWTLRPGDGVGFLYAGGTSRVRYRARTPAMVEVAGRITSLPATDGGYAVAVIKIPAGAQTVTLRCLAGEVTLDRIWRDE